MNPDMQHPGNTRPGDWACPSCQFHNFASRAQCYKCSTPNPDPSVSHTHQSMPTETRPGDWTCPNQQCNFHNYASRNHCMRCGSFKQGMGGGMGGYGGNAGYHGGASGARPGDWVCPNPACQFQNFASRNQCLRCGSHCMGMNMNGGAYGGYGGGGHFGGGGGGGGNSTFRQGDWYCPSCSSHNFASRQQCLRCNITKPFGMPDAPAGIVGQQSMKPGDWLCQTPSCGYHNFAKRSECAQCGAVGGAALNGEEEQGGY